MLEPGLALLLALVMAVVHFLGEELEEYISGYREQLISFTAGASISYIFVQLLPEFHGMALESGTLIFVFPLLGFSSIHLLEKYIAKADLSEEIARRDYGELHSSFLFLYHGAIGYLVASLVAESTVSGLLFFLPIVLHVAVSSFSVTELHENFMQRRAVKLSISVAPVLGVLAHQLGAISDQLFNPIFGTVIGMFFYVVIRDSIPRDDRGQPQEYITGTLIYLAVILAANAL
jgi:hypothetical protein